MPDRRAIKDSVYEQFARVAKAVANPHRLELLDLLGQCSRTVEALAQQTGMGLANTSQHLQVLRAASLVECERDGLFVTYRLADPQVADFFLSLRELASSRLAELERITRQFLTDRQSLEPVDRQNLLERVRSGEVVVIDVRPPEEYEAGHIPGARSIPLAELEERLAELPRNQQIVAYCRGPYCMLAIQAAELLRAEGFEALRIEEGVHEWRAKGFRLAIGEEELIASD